MQWVHKDVNIMKNIFSQEYFVNICRLVAKNEELDNVKSVGILELSGLKDRTFGNKRRNQNGD